MQTVAGLGVGLGEVAALSLSGACVVYLFGHLRARNADVPGWAVFLVGAAVPIATPVAVRAFGIEAAVRLLGAAVAMAVPVAVTLVVVNLLIAGEFR